MKQHLYSYLNSVRKLAERKRSSFISWEIVKKHEECKKIMKSVQQRNMVLKDLQYFRPHLHPHLLPLLNGKWNFLSCFSESICAQLYIEMRLQNRNGKVRTQMQTHTKQEDQANMLLSSTCRWQILMKNYCPLPGIVEAVKHKYDFPVMKHNGDFWCSISTGH